jgi:ATP/maltotriose-dependent transcriptional regulator MalT
MRTPRYRAFDHKEALYRRIRVIAREVVLRLVAVGFSNAEIATDLSIAETAR